MLAQAGSSGRTRMLAEFIRSNSNATAPQLEASLNNTASLFLARLSAWLRLTCVMIIHIKCICNMMKKLNDHFPFCVS